MEFPNYDELVKVKLTRTRCLALKKAYPEFCNHLDQLYPGMGFSEQIYNFFHPKSGTCKICGKSTKYYGLIRGYGTYCSTRCSRRDKDVEEARKNTCLLKYGTENPAQSPQVRDKMRQTCLERYGVEFGIAAEQTKKKIRQTYLERYGVDNPTKNRTIYQKSRQTCLMHNGSEVPSKSNLIKEKIVATTKQRHGGMGAASVKIKEKMQQTCLERYGVMNPGGLPETIEKSRKTKMQKYGSPYFSSISPISQKCFDEIDKLFCEKYETEYGTKNHEHHVFVNGKNYYLDFFVPKLNLCIEFFGDTWHGNPNIYGPNDYCIPNCKSLTAQDVWDKDTARIANLQTIGITTIVIWESEYKNCNNVSQLLLDKLAHTNIYI